MDVFIATESLYPFRWKGEYYRIMRAEIVNRCARAEVHPKNAELEKEIERRLTADGGLRVYLGFGYKCFPEDCAQEQTSGGIQQSIG